MLIVPYKSKNHPHPLYREMRTHASKKKNDEKRLMIVDPIAIDKSKYHPPPLLIWSKKMALRNIPVKMFPPLCSPNFSLNFS